MLSTVVSIGARVASVGVRVVVLMFCDSDVSIKTKSNKLVRVIILT